MAELADARDSNLRVLTDLGVRFPPLAQDYDKTASDLSVEQFLTLVSFDSKGKLDELGVNIDLDLIISSC